MHGNDSALALLVVIRVSGVRVPFEVTSGALATVTGTFASGPLVRVLGYRVIPFLALGGLIAALILGQELGEPAPAPATP